MRTRSPERRGFPARRPLRSAYARPAGARDLRPDCGGPDARRAAARCLRPGGALRSAAVSSDTPPAQPVSAATRSQGLAPLPATERGDYGAGPECGGLGALSFWEGAENQGVGGAGCAGNRRIVSGPCLLPVRGANGEGDHPKPRRGEGWWRGARPRSLLLPLHPRAEGRGGPPPHDVGRRHRKRAAPVFRGGP